MNKKRVIAYGILLIVVVALAFVGGIVYNESGGDFPNVPGLFLGKSFSGYVVSSDEKNLEIRTLSGTLEKFEITAATRIALPDKKIENGKYVRVIYKETNVGKIAKLVKGVKKAPVAPEGTPEASPATPGATEVSPGETPMETPGEATPVVSPEATAATPGATMETEAPKAPEGTEATKAPEGGETPKAPEGKEAPKAPEGEEAPKTP